MKRGDWFKKFNSSEKAPGDKETYYHIVDLLEDEKVLMDEYLYFTTLKKPVKNTKKPAEYPLKWLLEQVIGNNLYPVERDHVPFILNF